MNFNEIQLEKSQQWIKGLDTLRFVFALIVLLSHLPDPWANKLSGTDFFVFKYIGYLLKVSYCGVGAVIGFFIISGFVIHYQNKAGITNVTQFLIRRWLRIVLPLSVVSIVGFSIGHFDFIPIWSLYCELIYYSLYPLLRKFKINLYFLIGFSTLIYLVLAILLGSNDLASLLQQRNIGYSGAYWQLGDFLTWLIGLPCWLLGVLLAERIDSIHFEVSKKQITVLRFFVLLFSCILTALKFKFFVSYLFSMNLFSFVLFFWILAEILYRRSNSPLMILERFGEFSYSLYLCHNFIIYFLSLLWPIDIYTYPIYILAALTFSYLYFLIIERPSHKLSKYMASII